MTEKLKPCPFCGEHESGELKLSELEPDERFGGSVACYECGFAMWKTQWQTRPIEDRQRELVKEAAGELTVLAEMCDHYLSDDDRSRIATLSKRLEASDE